MSDLSGTTAAALLDFMEDAKITKTDVARQLDRSRTYVIQRVQGLYPLSLDIVGAVAELAGLTSTQITFRLAERMAETARGRGIVRQGSWQSDLAGEFRRAHVARPHLALDDILPGRPDLAQRALNGDPTLDEATLALVARGLGLDASIVKEFKDSTADARMPRARVV